MSSTSSVVHAWHIAVRTAHMGSAILIGVAVTVHERLRLGKSDGSSTSSAGTESKHGVT